MRNHRIYINDELCVGHDLSLDKETSHYMHTVLRLKSGYKIRVFNGTGTEYHATVSIDKKNCRINVSSIAKSTPERATRIHLIQAIARGDHMDFAIQKATELGVDEITPVISERTQHHDKARLEKRFTHWQKIIINACEQSGRCRLPALNKITAYDETVERCVADKKFICEPSDNKIENLNGHKNIAILVGPEGGLNQQEIEMAFSHDYTALSLGENVLRTETAATSALSIINYLLQ